MKNSQPSLHRYSNSRDVDLRLESSLVGGALRLGLSAALLVAVLLIYRDGYPLIAVLAAAYSLLCLAWRRAAPLRALYWRGGHWRGDLPGLGWCDITIGKPAHCLPWLIYLHWRRADERRWHPLCLWPDSASSDALRQLRKRLRLDT